jgi:hypothetical protein
MSGNRDVTAGYGSANDHPPTRAGRVDRAARGPKPAQPPKATPGARAERFQERSRRAVPRIPPYQNVRKGRFTRDPAQQCGCAPPTRRRRSSRLAPACPRPSAWQSTAEFPEGQGEPCKSACFCDVLQSRMPGDYPRYTGLANHWQTVCGIASAARVGSRVRTAYVDARATRAPEPGAGAPEHRAALYGRRERAESQAAGWPAFSVRSKSGK